ncbi:MOG interacting and ectopic P-granules protein 1 like protein [Argiope bruennichi]|uniref:MOG interacting and ectopic P-granules protein 1 n=1 Tax=Argiope bruennichi TaxID=94029 RepID=A0A8T0FC15_ARGBR|nr:MOG interacting and ectopic P-granules protein 1 like protein [Argiope bruennichi]
MDSATNGEVSEDCLSKSKETTDMLTVEECVEEAKHLNESKAMAEMEKCKTSVNSLSTSICETSQNKETSDQKALSSSSTSSNSVIVTEENSHIYQLENSSPSQEVLIECEEPPLRKENGISDSNDTEKSTKLTTDQNADEKTDSNADAANSPSCVIEEDSSSLKSNKETIQSSSEKLAEKCNKSEIDLSCSDMSDKKESDVILIDEQLSKIKESNISRSNTIEKKNPEIQTCRNKLMCGGSLVTDSCENQVQDLKVDSKQCSQKTKTDLLKHTSERNESCIDLTDDDGSENSAQIINELPLNFMKDKEPQIPLKPLESNTISNVSDRGGLVDLSINKWPQENPLQKLNEHLKSIGTDKERVPFNHNHIQKSDVCSANTSLSKGSEKMHSSDIYDKENNVEDSHHHERNMKEQSDSFVYAELSNEVTGFPDAFVGKVTIGKYIHVKGDFTLRSSEALLESPSLHAPYLLKEPDIFPPKEKDSKSETTDFFHSAAGELLIGIGISRVNEWFHKDMVRIKKRQMKRSGKTPQLEEELKMHEDLYAEARKANSVYSFTYQSCKNCGFTSESTLVMEGHLLVPHVTPRRDYQCNFCDSINRDPKAMLEHMLLAHGKVGRIQPPVLFFECPYCSFESNSKVKLNNHLAKCQRYFDHGINQAPPKDFEFPCLTPKPITVAVVKAYEKSLGSMQRGRGRPKKDISESLHMNQYASNANLAPITPNHMPAFRASSNSPLADSLSVQNQMISPPIQMPTMNIRPAHSNVMGQLRPAISHLHMPPTNRFFHFVNPSGQVMPMMGNNHLATSASQFPFSPPVDTSLGKKASSTPSFNPMLGSNLRQQTPAKGMPSVTITPLPKLQGPYPVPIAKPAAAASGSATVQSNSLVVCEICDGYIKDLEQLRTHMQLIHKVKIHPKMLVSRPPLNCQKCQWRFFTDQGLERHLLGAHGLVTSNMQELANKNRDAGCCTICGRVFGSKLVSHMNVVHKLTLKPAHLSYKCTVCSATFNLYRLFENHVYLVHSGAAKRSADGRSSPSKKMKSLDDSIASIESSNHKEKGTSKDIGDENCNKCKECGYDKKSQDGKCDKCLKSVELVHGTTTSTKTLNDELRKTEKTIEKAAA